MIRIRALMHAALLCGLLTTPVQPAQPAEPLRVQIVVPYIDIRSGPGRGYPIFHVFERGTWVEVLQQRTDWVQVRDRRGVVGWAAHADLAGTVSASGAPVSLSPTGRAAYLNRRIELAAVAGALDGDEAVGLRGSYQFTAALGAEIGLIHVPGTFSSTRLLTFNFTVAPLPAWRVEPTLTAGVGYFENIARPTLVDGDTADDWSANVGFGLRSHLTRNFVLRADLRRHRISISGDRQRLTEATAGIAVFF